MNATIELDIDNDYLRIHNKNHDARSFKVVYNYESGGDGYNEQRWANLDIFHVYENGREITNLIQRTNDITESKRKPGWPTLWDYISDEIKKLYE